MSSIVVRGLGPVWGTPSPSPFVIKVLTWLRMAGIDHELVPLRSPPRSQTRKIPYVELPGGEIVSDSSRIIARLSRDHGIDLDVGLDDRSRATARLLESTFAGHLYFAVLYERFATPEGFRRSDSSGRSRATPSSPRRAARSSPTRTSSPTSPACARLTGGTPGLERRHPGSVTTARVFAVGRGSRSRGASRLRTPHFCSRATWIGAVRSVKIAPRVRRQRDPPDAPHGRAG